MSGILQKGVLGEFYLQGILPSTLYGFSPRPSDFCTVTTPCTDLCAIVTKVLHSIVNTLKLGRLVLVRVEYHLQGARGHCCQIVIVICMAFNFC